MISNQNHHHRAPRVLVWLLLFGAFLVYGFIYLRSAWAQTTEQAVSPAATGDTYNFFFQKSNNPPIGNQQIVAPTVPKVEQPKESVLPPPQTVPSAPVSAVSQDKPVSPPVLQTEESSFRPFELSAMSMWGVSGGYTDSYSGGSSYFDSGQGWTFEIGLRFSRRIGLNIEYNTLAVSESIYRHSEDDFGFGSTQYRDNKHDLLSVQLDVVPLNIEAFGRDFLSLGILVGAGYPVTGPAFGRRVVPIIGLDVDLNVVDNLLVKVGFRHYMGHEIESASYLGAGIGVRL